MQRYTCAHTEDRRHGGARQPLGRSQRARGRDRRSVRRRQHSKWPAAIHRAECRAHELAVAAAAAVLAAALAVATCLLLLCRLRRSVKRVDELSKGHELVLRPVRFAVPLLRLLQRLVAGLLRADLLSVL